MRKRKIDWPLLFLLGGLVLIGLSAVFVGVKLHRWLSFAPAEAQVVAVDTRCTLQRKGGSPGPLLACDEAAAQAAKEGGEWITKEIEVAVLAMPDGGSATLPAGKLAPGLRMPGSAVRVAVNPGDPEDLETPFQTMDWVFGIGVAALGLGAALAGRRMRR